MIGQLREEIPDICLRTTLIAGFPGETEEEHEELMEFVDDVRVRPAGRIYLFPGGGHAGGCPWPDQIPRKNRRRSGGMS